VSSLGEKLAKVPLFSLLDARELAALAEKASEMQRPEGAELFHAGDPGDALYVVLGGSVELFFKRPTGERVVLEHAREGDFFGEISLLDGGPRMTSALVTSDLHALVVDREDLEALLTRYPSAAMDLLGATGRRLRETNRLLRDATSRNVNEETEDKSTRVDRAVDWVAAFGGSLTFLFIHVVLFAAWLGLNVEPLALTAVGGWDPFPFGLLTTSVSLEAIILSVFVLLSQNRQTARDSVRNDIEYQVNLKAELEVAQLHEKFDRLYEQVTRRLANLERGTSLGAPPRR
jgi:CRP/FNR family cyclic AMP-dependent transcriptional regulator